jgi:gas vesicle protein
LRHDYRISQNVNEATINAAPHGGTSMSESHDEADHIQQDGSNTLAWFLTGAIVGATAAILFTPSSGRETRRIITEKTQAGREAAVETGADIADASKDMFERGRKLVEDAADLFERGRKLVKG